MADSIQEPRHSSTETARRPKASGIPRFELISFDRIKIAPTPPFLIRGLLPNAGLAVIWGKPKSGKSFMALAMAMHIALGWDFDRRRTLKGSVVYLCPEGHSGFPARVEAFRQRFLSEVAEGVPFHLIASAVSLARDRAELATDIRAQLGRKRPAALFIDTVNRSLGGSENDDQAMGAYVDAALELSRSFDCLTVLVHHSGHEGGRMRGHSLLPAALDAEIMVEKEGPSVRATVKNMREGAEGEIVTGRLEVITVGQDSDGSDITSCAFVVTQDEPASSKNKAAKLPPGVHTLVKTLKDLLPDHGVAQRPFGSNGPEVLAVDREIVRAEFYARWPADAPTDKARAEAKRKQFNRAEQNASTRQIMASREIAGTTSMWLVDKS